MSLREAVGHLNANLQLGLEDVKRCTGCGGRMTVRAVLTDAASIARLLDALRRSRDPPVAACAPCPALAKRPPYVPATAESRPPHAPPVGPAPQSCEPSPTTLAYSPPTTLAYSVSKLDYPMMQGVALV